MSNIIASQVVITGAPVLLAPARPGRTEVRLKVMGTGANAIPIFVGQDNTVSPTTGFQVIHAPTVPDTGVLNLPVDGEVWGTRVAVAPLSISVLEIVP